MSHEDRQKTWGEGDADPRQDDLCALIRGEIRQGFDMLSVKLVDEFRHFVLQDLVQRRAFHEQEPAPTKPAFGHRAPATTAPDMFVEAPERPSEDALSEHATINNVQVIFGGDQTSDALRVEKEPSAPSAVLPRRCSRHAIISDVIKHEKSLETYVHHVVYDIGRRYMAGKLRKECPDTWLARCVVSGPCTAASFLFIVVNILWMTHSAVSQVADKIKSSSSQDESILRVVNLTFSTCFALEVVLKIVALHWYFVFGPDRIWNFLDLFLVAISIPEFFNQEDVQSLGFLRMLRLCRTFRALRLMRLVKFIGGLREILLSFVDTLGFLSWSFVAMFIVTYVFSLIFLQLLVVLLDEGVEPSDEVLSGFDSWSSSMLSLFCAISGGQDWRDIADGFGGSHSYIVSVFRYSFATYIFIILFGFSNCIIGIFCTRANEASSCDEDLLIAKEESHYRSIVKRVIHIFHDMGVDVSGSITREQLHQYVQSDKSLALRGMPGFQGLQFFGFQQLWQVLMEFSNTHDETLDLPGCVMAILRFSGTAAATEAVMISFETRRAVKALAKLEELHQSHAAEHNSAIEKLHHTVNTFGQQSSAIGETGELADKKAREPVRL